MKVGAIETVTVTGEAPIVDAERDDGCAITPLVIRGAPSGAPCINTPR
jgi:hypothetical protein